MLRNKENWMARAELVPVAPMARPAPQNPGQGYRLIFSLLVFPDSGLPRWKEGERKAVWRLSKQVALPSGSGWATWLSGASGGQGQSCRDGVVLHVLSPARCPQCPPPALSGLPASDPGLSSQAPSSGRPSLLPKPSQHPPRPMASQRAHPTEKPRSGRTPVRGSVAQVTSPPGSPS